MPVYDLTSTLTDPSGDLTDGQKYVIQNQGSGLAYVAVKAATFSVAPDDPLILGSVRGNTNMPSHMEYTYAAAEFIRLWGDTKVVMHPIS